MDGKNKVYDMRKILLPMKFHYFLMFASDGCIIPFVNLIGKGIGISATAVGIINTAQMGLTLFSRPLMGTMVDYFRNIRIFLICLIVLNVGCSLCFLLLPPIEAPLPELTSVTLRLLNNSEDFINGTISMNSECLKEIVSDSKLNCNVFQMQNGSQTEGYEENIIKTQFDVTWKKEFQVLNLTRFNSSNKTNDTIVVYKHLNVSVSANSSDLEQSQLFYFKCEPDEHPCSFRARTLSVNQFKTYQFWVFMLLLVLTGLASKNACSLSDVTCCELLGEQRYLYGRQRLFGTVGWSIACLTSGYLSDFATGDSKRKDYSPGIYIMTCLLLPHIFTMSKLLLVKVKMSSSVVKDVKKVFYSSEIILFATGATLGGMLSAAIFYYELWYLQDLGASQSLLGWVIIVQGLIAEAPFFFISGWLIKKFGCFNCLVVSFAAFTLRFGCYAIITNPWWALLIDTTHGFTYAIAHAAVTNFVSSKAPEGVHGTMFGIFGGLIEGLGFALGSLLCGAAFDKFGERTTFIIASIFSGACALAFSMLSRLLNRRQQT